MNRFSRVIAIPLAPILLVQSRRLRSKIPRMPDAALPWTGSLAGPRAIRLLVIGDSTASGVGAATQDEALPGRLARTIFEQFGRGTRWRAIGRNGATSRDLVTDFMRKATESPADLVFVTIGANDALGLRSRRAFRRDVTLVVTTLREANPEALILVSLMPRFDRFASLPNPVKWNLALHAASLEAGVRPQLKRMPGVFAIPKPIPYTPEFWATDSFHPSAEGYQQWAHYALGSVPEPLLQRYLN